MGVGPLASLTSWRPVRTKMRHHIITCTGVRVLLQQRETCCSMNTYMSLYSVHIHCIYTLIISPCSVVYTDTCEHTCTHTSMYCAHTYTHMILYHVTKLTRTPHSSIFQVQAVVDTPSSTQALSHVTLVSVPRQLTSSSQMG